MLSTLRLTAQYFQIHCSVLSDSLLRTFRLTAPYFQAHCSVLSDSLVRTFRLTAPYFQAHCSVLSDTWQCPEGEVKCPNTNLCIEKAWLCDGDHDCHDNWDEQAQNCPSTAAPGRRLQRGVSSTVHADKLHRLHTPR